MTTRTVTEAETIAQGWAAYHRVKCAEWTGNGDDIRDAIDGLLEALETHRDVLNGITHPATAYPELEYEDDAYARALEMAAQDAADWTGELGRLVPEADEGEKAA